MDNNRLSKEAYVFLLYTCFGLTEDDLNNKESIIEKCAKSAYSDLARTVKYWRSTNELETENKDIKDNYPKFKETTIISICILIRKSILGLTADNDFNSWHIKTCESIIKAMNNATYSDHIKLLKEEFSYGQAQKWLNMTLKFLWLLGKLPDSVSETHLHAPIDNYILQAVFETIPGNDKSKTRELIIPIIDEVNTLSIKKTSKTDYYYKTNLEKSTPEGTADGYKPWSKIPDFGDYHIIQEAIRYIANNICTPVRWESEKWIEIARKRSVDTPTSNI